MRPPCCWRQPQWLGQCPRRRSEHAPSWPLLRRLARTSPPAQQPFRAQKTLQRGLARTIPRAQKTTVLESFREALNHIGQQCRRQVCWLACPCTTVAVAAPPPGPARPAMHCSSACMLARGQAACSALQGPCLTLFLRCAARQGHRACPRCHCLPTCPTEGHVAAALPCAALRCSVLR